MHVCSSTGKIFHVHGRAPKTVLHAQNTNFVEKCADLTFQIIYVN